MSHTGTQNPSKREQLLVRAVGIIEGTVSRQLIEVASLIGFDLASSNAKKNVESGCFLRLSAASQGTTGINISSCARLCCATAYAAQPQMVSIVDPFMTRRHRLWQSGSSRVRGGATPCPFWFPRLLKLTDRAQ